MPTTQLAVGVIVGLADGAAAGEPVGPVVVGDNVGDDAVGDAVGSDAVGDVVGDAVIGELVGPKAGEIDGPFVGREVGVTADGARVCVGVEVGVGVAGDAVGESVSAMLQVSPRWVSAHEHAPLSSTSPFPLHVTALLYWQVLPAWPSRHSAHRPHSLHPGEYPSMQMQPPL